MRTQQDVRENPIVGDVATKQGEIREVLRVVETFRGSFRLETLIWNCEERAGAAHAWAGNPTITQWRAWAKNAKVVNSGA